MELSKLSPERQSVVTLGRLLESGTDVEISKFLAEAQILPTRAKEVATRYTRGDLNRTQAGDALKTLWATLKGVRQSET